MSSSEDQAPLPLPRRFSTPEPDLEPLLGPEQSGFPRALLYLVAFDS